MTSCDYSRRFSRDEGFSVIEATLIELTEHDVWAIQSLVKHDMLVRLDGQAERRAGLTLRQKVNGLIVEYTEQRALGQQPPAEGIKVALTAEELWLIDKQLLLTYTGARELLIRVFKALSALEGEEVSGIP